MTLARTRPIAALHFIIRLLKIAGAFYELKTGLLVLCAGFAYHGEDADVQYERPRASRFLVPRRLPRTWRR
jgi:hypothetical protein